MPDSTPIRNFAQARTAFLVAVFATVLAAFAGLVLFLAGSLTLGLDVTAPYPAVLSGPAGLLAHGPLGYATWMALLMAGGSPLVGLAVFAMLFLGGRNAN